jgi:hypothetical protein
MSLHPSSDRQIRPLPHIDLAGHRVLPDSTNFRWRDDLGIVTALALEAQRICIDSFTCHPRAVRLPNGETLLFAAAGPLHYGWARKDTKGNSMRLYRSTDAWNWAAPVEPWSIPYSQHAVGPFLPSGSDELYVFGTEPRHDRYDGEENAAIGFRSSSDAGHTWSEVTLIEPKQEPGFQGMSAMRPCETADGSWLVGSHSGHWSGTEGIDRKVVTQQFLLRSEDRGRHWDLLPGSWPKGWQTPGTERMDEGRPIHLGDNRVLLLVRTPTGFLWELRSKDAGRSWTEPKPTTLRHPDAPPMIFHLDAETLAVFHHNKQVSGAFAHESRTELWVSLSQDEGHTWSEPRFVLANACEAAVLNGWGGWSPMVSYVDLLVHGDTLDLFVDHQMRQVLQVRFSKGDLLNLPTAAELS